jgi:hypothetical protein
LRLYAFCSAHHPCKQPHINAFKYINAQPNQEKLSSSFSRQQINAPSLRAFFIFFQLKKMLEALHQR